MHIPQDKHILDYLDDSLELSVPRDCIVFMITFSSSEGRGIEAGRLQGGRPAVARGEQRGGGWSLGSPRSLSLPGCQGPVLLQSVQQPHSDWCVNVDFIGIVFNL